MKIGQHEDRACGACYVFLRVLFTSVVLPHPSPHQRAIVDQDWFSLTTMIPAISSSESYSPLSSLFGLLCLIPRLHQRSIVNQDWCSLTTETATSAESYPLCRSSPDCFASSPSYTSELSSKNIDQHDDGACYILLRVPGEVPELMELPLESVIKIFGHLLAWTWNLLGSLA